MNFPRLLDFCDTMDEQAPQEDIRRHLQKGLLHAPQAFAPYEQALERLDEQTWEVVKRKLLQKTIKDSLRGWSQLFDTLAEVKAYCYLLDEGYTDVHFIPETTTKTPDIEATKPDGTRCFLESKSIGSSDDERTYLLENTRRIKDREPLIVRDVVLGMPQELKDKLEKTIESAKGQVLPYLPNETSAERIIYLTIQLDTHMILEVQNYLEVKNFVNNLKKINTQAKIIIDELSSI